MSAPSTKSSEAIRQAVPPEGEGAPFRLVVSLHDVAPHSREAYERFLKTARGLGVDRVSLLVVPDWHGRAPFHEDRAFVDWLRERSADGHDCCLHGFTHRSERPHPGWRGWWLHRFYTDREDEFYTLDPTRAAECLREGRARFEAEGIPVNGFTAPAWLLRPDLHALVRETGPGYITHFDDVEWPGQGRRLAAPVLVFSSRAAWRRAVSSAVVPMRAWRFRWQPVVRLAVHPGDLHHAEVERRILDILEDQLAYRLPCRYADLSPC